MGRIYATYEEPSWLRAEGAKQLLRMSGSTCDAEEEPTTLVKQRDRGQATPREANPMLQPEPPHFRDALPPPPADHTPQPLPGAEDGRFLPLAAEKRYREGQGKPGLPHEVAHGGEAI